jgi:hypothetical protein
MLADLANLIGCKSIFDERVGLKTAVERYDNYLRGSGASLRISHLGKIAVVLCKDVTFRFREKQVGIKSAAVLSQIIPIPESMG